MRFAEIMAKSTLVPRDYIDKPGNILVAIQKGFEIGLSPMNALESIAVINGRCTLWGDGMLALVQASPAYEWHTEDESTDQVGVHVIKRKGHKEHRSEFTLQDAQKAGLLGKPGPWQQYTKRMLTLRARGFALRDKFADALKGMISAEEAMDLPMRDAIPAQVESPTEPLTLKEKLKVKVEDLKIKDNVEIKDKVETEEKAAPGGALESTPAPGDEVVTPPSSGSGPPSNASAEPSRAPDTSTITIQELTAKMRLCESIKEWSTVENAALSVKEQGGCTAAEWATYQGVSGTKKKSLTGKK